MYNFVKLVEDLNYINITPDTKLCSFYISNTYSNIPKHEVFDIILNILRNIRISEGLKLQLQILVVIIVEQNYFEHNLIYYKQLENLAMGGPT